MTWCVLPLLECSASIDPIQILTHIDETAYIEMYHFIKPAAMPIDLRYLTWGMNLLKYLLGSVLAT